MRAEHQRGRSRPLALVARDDIAGRVDPRFEAGFGAPADERLRAPPVRVGEKQARQASRLVGEGGEGLEPRHQLRGRPRDRPRTGGVASSLGQIELQPAGEDRPLLVRHLRDSCWAAWRGSAPPACGSPARSGRCARACRAPPPSAPRRSPPSAPAHGTSSSASSRCRPPPAAPSARRRARPRPAAPRAPSARACRAKPSRRRRRRRRSPAPRPPRPTTAPSSWSRCQTL